jgi:hypothetical protein
LGRICASGLRLRVGGRRWSTIQIWGVTGLWIGIVPGLVIPGQVPTEPLIGMDNRCWLLVSVGRSFVSL